MNILLSFAFLLLLFHDNLYSMQKANNPRLSYIHTIDYTQPFPYVTCVPQFTHDITDPKSIFYKQDETTCIAYLQGALEIIQQYDNFNALYTQYPEEQACLLATISDIDTTMQNLLETKKFYELIDNKNIAPILLAISTTIPAVNLLCLFKKYFSLEHQTCPQATKEIENLLVQCYYPFHQNFETLLPILPRAYDAVWNINRTMILNYVYQSLHHQKNNLVDTTNAYEKREQAIKNLVAQKNEYTNALTQLQTKNSLQNSLLAQASAQTIETQTEKDNEKQVKHSTPASSSEKSILKICNKTNHIQQQQQEKLVAEKRAEQSRIDKERHKADLEKKAKEESLAAAAKLTTIPEIKNVKKKKKLVSKQSVIIDEDDAYLDQLLAEKNTSISNTKSVDTVAKTEESCDEVTTCMNFIDSRNKKILELEQAKEIQRKKDIATCLKTAAKDRDNKKDYLAKKRDQDFSYRDQNELLALQYLHDYTNYVLSIKCIDEKFLTYFQITTQRLIEKEHELALQGTHLKWYLAANPALYQKMKVEYAHLNRMLYKTATSELHVIKIDHIQEIAGTLQKIHTAGGILDITEYMYPIKTKVEVDQLGILPDNALKQAHQDIEILNAKVSIKNNYQLLQPIVVKLLHQAGIKHQPSDLINEMVYEAQKISQQEANQQNQTLDEFGTHTFHTLQKVTEMNDLNFTENNIADLTKIYAVVITSLVKILQIP